MCSLFSSFLFKDRRGAFHMLPIHHGRIWNPPLPSQIERSSVVIPLPNTVGETCGLPPPPVSSSSKTISLEILRFAANPQNSTSLVSGNPSRSRMTTREIGEAKDLGRFVAVTILHQNQIKRAISFHLGLILPFELIQLIVEMLLLFRGDVI